MLHIGSIPRVWCAKLRLMWGAVSPKSHTCSFQGANDTVLVISHGTGAKQDACMQAKKLACNIICTRSATRKSASAKQCQF